MDSSKPHAALFAGPGIGHLVPIIELSKHLVTRHGFNVTVFVIASQASPVKSKLIDSATTSDLLDIVQLPFIDVSGLVEPDATVTVKLTVMMREARPALRTAISSMKYRPSIFIVDLFGTEALEIADEFEMAKYVYMATSAWLLALTVYLPTLDKVVEGDYVDKKEPLQIPGCKPIRPEDVIDPLLDRANPQYHEFVRVGAQIPMADGILINTWEELEPITLGALREDEILSRAVKVPVYPIGPLAKSVGPAGSRSELLNWLDMQPAESVIFVSFGSGGTLSTEQTTELAWGLEQSQQRFIWVVRPPTDGDASASFLSTGNSPDDTSGYLPEGFLIRTQEIGQVVPQWAPQEEILSHPSVGGFLSHCGWNSTLESITNGVPIIAWPLYAEQKMNATMLTEELGVAVRPKELPSKKVVKREEIEMMVRMVMEKREGNAIRDKIKKLQASGMKALSKGGSSYNSLSHVASQIHPKKPAIIE